MTNCSMSWMNYRPLEMSSWNHHQMAGSLVFPMSMIRIPTGFMLWRLWGWKSTRPAPDQGHQARSSHSTRVLPVLSLEYGAAWTTTRSETIIGVFSQRAAHAPDQDQVADPIPMPVHRRTQAGGRTFRTRHARLSAKACSPMTLKKSSK